MSNKLLGFSTYQKPGVYTKSIRGTEGLNNFGGYRIPTFIGPASELVLKEDVPVMRGSSKRFPILVERENISAQIASGTTLVIASSKAPLINPETGLVTNNVQHISLEIDGNEVTPLKIIGENAQGNSEIHLPFIPETGAKGYLTYHYIRRDISLTSPEDLTSQVDGIVNIFHTKFRNLVDDSGVGKVTNDPKYILVRVNGIITPAVSLLGKEGQFTLVSIPAIGSMITVEYKYTNFKDFSDPLPNKFIQRISRVGNAPQRRDYTEGVDFNLSSEVIINDSTFHEVAWGNSFAITSLQDSSDEFENTWKLEDNIDVDIADLKIYGELLKPIFSSSDTILTDVFETDFKITDGTGKGRSLFDSDVDDSIFAVYMGTTAKNALPDGGVGGNKVALKRVDGTNRRIYLQSKIDPKVQGLFVVYNTNKMESHEYEFKKVADEISATGINPLIPATYSIVAKDYGFVPRIQVQKQIIGTETGPLVPLGINPFYTDSYDDNRVPLNHPVDESITISFEALLGYQLTSTSYRITGCSPQTDGGGELLVVTFQSLNRDLASLVGSRSTTTGFANGVNNVTSGEIVSAGLDFIKVRTPSTAIVETITPLNPNPPTMDIILASTDTFKYVVTSDKVGFTGSDVTVNEAYNGTIHQGLKRNEGILGEPYTDPKTGVSFNIKSTSGWTIVPGVTAISFKVEKAVNYSISAVKSEINLEGLNYRVSNLLGVLVGDSIRIQSNNFAGEEPSLGSLYYVSYYHYRLDYSANLYLSFSDVEQAFGKANLENPLSLCAKIAFENGAPVVALKPLTKYTEDTFSAYLARDLDPAQIELENIQLYKDAIDSLALPMDQDRRPYFMMVTTDDSQVWNHLKSHVERYSAPEWKAERVMFGGFNTNRTDSYVMERARNFKSERVLIVYPAAVIADIEADDHSFSRAIIPGYYFSAALMGLASRSSMLPSEPLTRKTLLGFVEVASFKNEMQLNDLAQEGITIIEFENPEFKIRHALNTDMTDTLTREPTVTFVADYMQLLTRKVLDRFIARPHINSLVGEIETIFTGFLSLMRQSNIITAYRNVKVQEHPSDPTIVLVSAEYSPVLPLNYIFVTYQIEGSLN